MTFTLNLLHEARTPVLFVGNPSLGARPAGVEVTAEVRESDRGGPA